MSDGPDGAGKREFSDGIRLGSAIPIALAAVLATLYTIGALAKITEIRGAGLNPRDALPLVPIEQLLARGVGTAFAAVLVVGVMALLGAGLLLVDRRRVAVDRRRSLAIGRHQAHRGTWRDFLAEHKTFVGLQVALLCIILFVLPIPAALGALGGFAAGIAFGIRRVRVRYVLVTLYTLTVSFLLLSSYFRPPQLPGVSVQTTDGSLVRGGLLAVSNGAWHIAREDEHQIVSLPQDRVTRTVIARRKTRQVRTRSLLEIAIRRRIYPWPKDET